MPAIIPIVAGAVATAMEATIIVAAAVGAVAGAVVAAGQGESILKGALMGGIGGLAGGAMATAAGFGAAAETASAGLASGAEALTGSSTAMLGESAAIGNAAAGYAAPMAAEAGASVAATGAAEAAGAGLSGTGLSSVSSGTGGLFDAAVKSTLGGDYGLGASTAGANSGILPAAQATTSQAAADTGLLGKAANWAKDNPTLAMGAMQILGSGMTGMSAASTAEDAAQAKLENDELIRKNSAFVKLPKTVWS